MPTDKLISDCKHYANEKIKKVLSSHFDGKDIKIIVKRYVLLNKKIY